MHIKVNSSKLTFNTDYQKLLQNLFDFNLGSFITEVFNVSSSIESKAFYFLYNVNQKTNVELLKQLGQNNIDKTQNLIIVSNELKQDWREYFETEVIITKDFFENIIEHDPQYLRRSYKLFECYSRTLGIEIPKNFYFEYYQLFNKNMIEEFQFNKSKYEGLVEFFDNPIDDQKGNFLNQIQHYMHIKSYFTNPIQFGIDECKETLKDLYIEPNFQIFKNNIRENKFYDFNSPQDQINIHDFLSNYFLKDLQYAECKANYNMLFVLGQPGQGKTSFCYKLIHDILEESNGLPDSPLFFIKIRDLIAKDFVNDTFNTINHNICQNIDFQKDSCLLVLDGLDEAYMSGGLTDQDLKNLYERLNKTSKYNKKLKIILTSRLNYLNINDPSLDGSLVIKLDELNDNQIKLYVEKFKIFYPDNLLIKKVDEILENDELDHIKELLKQAVLMYFIALSNIDVERNDSKAVIYGKIFDSLAKRSWDNNGQLNYIKPDLKEDSKGYSKYLRQYVRSIAFEIYQSPNLHISIKSLNELESTSQFTRRCFNEDVLGNPEIIRNISKYLLISFYFQNSAKKNQEEDTAIEFFHNSLWEYLTAEHIWEELKRVVLNVDVDNDLQQINLDEYFFTLTRLIGNKDLDSEIRFNLENIIENEDIDIIIKVIKQTESVFYKLIEKDILLEYNYKNEILTSKEKVHNIFTLMWTLYYQSCKKAKQVITTNTTINDLIFDFNSDFNYRYSLNNIIFADDIYKSVNIVECLVEDVTFDMKYGYSVSLVNNVMENVVFRKLNGDSNINSNDFTNVTFENSVIHANLVFANNTLDNCKFVNVRIPHKYWLDEVQQQNNCHESLIESHKVYEEEEEDNEMKITIYYLTTIDL